MTNNEVLTLIISCIAAFISLVVWNGQRKLHKESNDLQRATSELAKKQLEILVREDIEKTSARLRLDLVKDGKGYRFIITNIGKVDAMDVDLELLLEKPEHSPLIKSDYEAKLPAKKLSPDSSLSLIAALSFGKPTAFNAKLSWKNPDGGVQQDETYASL
ncbi:MAG: hypothetical protein P1U35_02060 [Cycloclasticus sp.]|nr:hypothetical protein [Cycloclasticus sp.]